MKTNYFFHLVAVTGLFAACSQPAPLPPQNPTAIAETKPSTEERATELAKRFIIIDGHIDVPYRLDNSKNENGRLSEDIADKTVKGDFDYPRAKEGGLDAPFMSIYVPASFQESGGAKKVADRLIDMVEEIVRRAPDRFALAHSTSQLEANAKAGLISLPLGIENGAALEGKVENVKHFARRGVRYITLTHSKDNELGDSSYDDSRSWKGLSPTGRKVVKEMNQEGIMVDISHVSDDTFHQVLSISQVPVIASHSSVRHFTPGFERNMSDEMILKLAKAGGVIMINFGSSFIKSEAQQKGKIEWEALRAIEENNKLSEVEKEQLKAEYRRKNPFPFASVEDVANHIDHVVKLVGDDHVGFGSDFDGVGDTLPTGLKDVSYYPSLIKVLLERGYTEESIKKICSGNVIRVWKQVEEFARTGLAN